MTLPSDKGSAEAQPSILPAELIRDFSSGFLANRDRYLAAVNAFGSPLYLVEKAVLIERAAQFKRAFLSRFARAGFYYAMKSNNLPYLSGVLLDQGYGLDVSSGVELETAIRLGAPDIIFSGPGKTDAELELASRHCDRVTVLLDSFGECRRLADIASQKRREVRVGVRLNLNPNGLWRKFGILVQDLPELFAAIQHHPQLTFKGLQFHSSWNMAPDTQVALLGRLGEGLAAMSESFWRQCRFVDIGGGYWPPLGEWLLSSEPGHYHLNPATGIDEFAERLAAAVEKELPQLSDCRICFEPGRWICNDTMHLLLTVVDRKAPDMVITDAGTNAVGWERFEIDYFPVLNLTRGGLEEHPCHVFGSLCTPHDIWGFSYLGTDIREGDVLMVPTQGAYTYSLRQHFIKALPRVAVVDKNEHCFILDPEGERMAHSE